MMARFPDRAIYESTMSWAGCRNCDNRTEYYYGNHASKNVKKELSKNGWRIVSGRLLCGECAKRETNTK